MEENGVISEEAEKSIQFYTSSRQLGLSIEESKKIYDKWAETYDMKCPLVGYNGPQHIAKAVAEYYPIETRDQINVIDVAAGTGLVGKELAQVGFRHIDAVEPSDGMLNHLKKLNVYKQIFQEPIGLGDDAELGTDSYDCLTIAGGLGNGHIPVKGGTIFIVMLEEHLNSDHACNGELEPYMDELEAKSCWTKIRRTIVDNYTWKEPGIIFAFKVLVSTV